MILKKKKEKNVSHHNLIELDKCCQTLRHAQMTTAREFVKYLFNNL